MEGTPQDMGLENLYFVARWSSDIARIKADSIAVSLLLYLNGGG